MISAKNHVWYIAKWWKSMLQVLGINFSRFFCSSFNAFDNKSRMYASISSEREAMIRKWQIIYGLYMNVCDYFHCLLLLKGISIEIFPLHVWIIFSHLQNFRKLLTWFFLVLLKTYIYTDRRTQVRQLVEIMISYSSEIERENWRILLIDHHIESMQRKLNPILLQRIVQ